MNRRITDHTIGGTINGSITVEAVGKPTEGGANAAYEITAGGRLTAINFHAGEVADITKPLGLTNESLASVLIDRIRGFQGENATGVSGLPCKENENALRCFQEGLMWLQKRTRDRLSRGVEGKPGAP